MSRRRTTRRRPGARHYLRRRQGPDQGLPRPRPAQPGPHAAILYVQTGSATRRRPTAPSFSIEAVALAGRGVVSLLVDRCGRMRNVAGPQPGRIWPAASIRSSSCAAPRPAAGQPGGDPKRVAMVAHDFGAMFRRRRGRGRPASQGLRLPGSHAHLSDWYLFNVKPVSVEDYRSNWHRSTRSTAVGGLAVHRRAEQCVPPTASIGSSGPVASCSPRPTPVSH